MVRKISTQVSLLEPFLGFINVLLEQVPLKKLFYRREMKWLLQATVSIRKHIKLLRAHLSLLLTSAFINYRATTVLVLTFGSGVNGFTLDPDTSKFLHTHEDIRIPSSGGIYSFNEANFHHFSEPVQRYLDALKAKTNSIGKK